MRSPPALPVALAAALLCTLPLLVWASGVIAVDPGAWPVPVLGGGVVFLWWVQALCVAVFVPPCATLWRSGEVLAALLLFVMFPLPVLTLGWMAAVVSMDAVAWVLAGLMAAGVLALVLARGIQAGVPRGVALQASLVILQVVGVTVVACFGEGWLVWAGV